MQKPEGLAKAAAVMAIVAALATLLAVNVDPPTIKKERSTSVSENRVPGIPVPAATHQGGVGVAQERGTAVERREAGGRRAPENSAETEQKEGAMSVMTVVNLALFLVLVLFGVSVCTPRGGTIRHAKTGPHSNGAFPLVVLLLFCLMACGTAYAAQEPAQAAPPPAAPRAEAAPASLTNAEIREMVKAGFTEETILKSIQLSETRFDTSVAALVELKNAGVSEKVIQAMLSPKAAKAEEKPAAPRNPLLPDDVGIFYIKNDQLVDMRPELAGWRSGGVGKALLLGTKGHINGALKGPQSQNIVATPVEFIIRCPEQLEIEEYELLRLDVKPDRREFRALTGGYIHSSSGLDKNSVPFRFEKIAPRVYRVTLGNLPKGEYGFLPPGGQFGAMGGGASGAMIMQGSASSGKIYSFRVIE